MYILIGSTTCRPNEELKKDVIGLFTSCTKDDVTLNNYITRSRIFGNILYMFFSAEFVVDMHSAEC